MTTYFYVVRQDHISRKVYILQRGYSAKLFSSIDYRSLESRRTFFSDTSQGCAMDQPYRYLLRKDMQELQRSIVFCFENEHVGPPLPTE
jgi:hypothetical protein